MPQCPICDTEYTDETITNCCTCGYTLNNIESIGNIPNAYLEQQTNQINWARNRWLEICSQQEKSKIRQENIAQLSQEINKLKNQHSDCQSQLSFISSQLETSTQTNNQLESQLEQLQLERNNLENQQLDCQRQLSLA